MLELRRTASLATRAVMSVVLQYRTEVSGDRTVTETVVPMKDDGAWRISGYFVQP